MHKNTEKSHKTLKRCKKQATVFVTVLTVEIFCSVEITQAVTFTVPQKEDKS